MDYKGFEREEHFDRFSFYNGDCMELLKQTPDKYYEICIVDPPYGIDLANMNMGIGKSKRSSKIENRKWKPKDWDKNTPSNEYFQELFRISKNQIIWGGNYFGLPPTRCYLVWDKGEGFYNRTYAECELAWTSFDKNTVKFKRDPLAKGDYHNKIHPTQKPVGLYSWLIQKYAKKGDKILDTHLGSASIALAIDKANKADGMELDFVGIELDKDYFDSAMKRFSKGRQQMFLNLNEE